MPKQPPAPKVQKKQPKAVQKPKLKPKPKVAKKVILEEPLEAKPRDNILEIIDASYGKKSARDRFREQLSFVLNEPKGKQAYTEVTIERAAVREVEPPKPQPARPSVVNRD